MSGRDDELRTEIVKIVDDALNAAIPEPWEVSAFAANRILALPAFAAAEEQARVAEAERDEAIDRWLGAVQHGADIVASRNAQVEALTQQLEDVSQAHRQEREEVEALTRRVAELEEALRKIVQKDQHTLYVNGIGRPVDGTFAVLARASLLTPEEAARG